MLLRRLTFGFGVCLLAMSCSPAGRANVDEAVSLTRLQVGGVGHDFGVFPNQQGPDSPCVVGYMSTDGAPSP